MKVDGYKFPTYSIPLNINYSNVLIAAGLQTLSYLVFCMTVNDIQRNNSPRNEKKQPLTHPQEVHFWVNRPSKYQ